MRKTIARILTVVALVGGTAVVSATSVSAAKSEAKVQKFATSDALYSITTTKQTATPPGCVGSQCPQVETDVPALTPADGFTELVGAKKIDTYTTSMGSQTSKGGCAISSAGKLLCWGSNTYGQLGNGKIVDSLTTPVEAVGLTGVITDVTTNGFTTCVVTDAGGVKCVGRGSWPEFTRLEVNGGAYIEERVWDNATQNYTTTSSNTNTNTCQILKAGAVVAETTNCWSQSSNFSLAWVDLFTSGVKKVQIAGSGGWDNANICVLKTDNTVSCSKVLPGARGSSTGNNTQEYDCDFDGIYEGTQWCQRGPADPVKFRVRNNNNNKTPWTAATWSWVDSEYTNVVDFAMSEQAWGGDGTMCFIQGAEQSVSCRPFSGVQSSGDPNTPISTSGGTWGKKNEIEGVYQAEKVFITTFNGIGLCVWAQGTLYCGTASWDGSTMKFPTSVSSVGIMARPISIFAVSGPSGKVYFATENGILAADQWVFNCSQCAKQSGGVLSAVGAFKNATSGTYFYVNKLTGATDSPDLIPMQVDSGERKVLSQKAITIKTSTGAALAGASVRWTAPDVPDTLGSSTKATDTTDDTGLVRLAAVATGPVAFTLKGGKQSDGSYLQAAVVTVNVPATGTVEVVVPVSSAVVDRSVTVQLTDGTAVPNAVVQLANNYLTYNYVNDGAKNASWSATAPDTKGFMQSAQCAFCFVPPPTYITGADGKVTWKSFDPKTRSSQYDATVMYDDGSLQQKKKVNFDSISQTVSLDYMANIQTTLPSEVTPKADGSVEIPVSLKDGDNLPISGLEAKAEEVCGEMQQGGLWSGTSSVQEGYCSGQGPTSGTGTGSSTGSVSKSGVSSFACAASSGTKTDSKGSATVKLCPSKSGYYRVRSSGVLPSKSICVKVNNQPCTVTLQNSIAGSTGSTTSGGTSLTGGTSSSDSTLPPTPKTVKAKGKVATSKFLKAYSAVKKAGAVKIVGSGACKVVGKNVIAGSKKGVCRLTVTQAAKGKVKGAKKKVFRVKVV
jgi:hypothetical protein